MPLDNPQELFYWVDTDDQVLGSITRQQAHLDKTKIHRAIEVVLTNTQHHVLLQKRSHRKDKYPGYWTVTACGHVEYGSSYEETAVKELQQEVGIAVPLTYQSTFIMQLPTETEMIALFSGTAPESTTFLVDPTEVEMVKWVRITDLSSFAKHHKFTLASLQALRLLGFLKE